MFTLQHKMQLYQLLLIIQMLGEIENAVEETGEEINGISFLFDCYQNSAAYFHQGCGGGSIQAVST